MSVDNEIREFYVNGNNVSVVPATFPHALQWDVPDTYILTCGVLYVLAIKGWNNENDGGFIASTPDHYILTNNSWKCTTTYYADWYKTNYDASFWPDAHYGIAQAEAAESPPFPTTSAAMWITDPTDCLKCIFYCRKTFTSKSLI
ncbi:hypothetical protein HELRODRAFT_179269 [Helobdella robusta]|uniref:Uncharacterized protein n=1 Tax=Helobdella robusta TaxID=6412 RepID=T1FEG4_HELRO|nr:hypothetical protein HELRODRAFT_179269 [Helobdella robusta]ESN95496.1 hypothetical protein HELRODRAFT_179269 [Helobdella robusta]